MLWKLNVAAHFDLCGHLLKTLHWTYTTMGWICITPAKGEGKGENNLAPSQKKIQFSRLSFHDAICLCGHHDRGQLISDK